MLKIFLLLLLSTLSADAGDQADDAPVIVVVGDSLSAAYGIDPGQGWVALLAARLREQGYGHRVVNASISGDTTRGGRARLPRALKVHRPDIVIVELGGNDALRGQPLAEVRANLGSMIAMSRDAGSRVLLTGIAIPANYGRAYADSFRAVYRELAATEQVALVPFLLEGVALDPTLFQADGIHPGAAAQPRLLENVWSQLQPLLDEDTTADTTGHPAP